MCELNSHLTGLSYPKNYYVLLKANSISLSITLASEIIISYQIMSASVAGQIYCSYVLLISYSPASRYGIIIIDNYICQLYRIESWPSSYLKNVHPVAKEPVSPKTGLWLMFSVTELLVNKTVQKFFQEYPDINIPPPPPPPHFQGCKAMKA